MKKKILKKDKFKTQNIKIKNNYACNYCGKIYKTFLGLEKHYMKNSCGKVSKYRQRKARETLSKKSIHYNIEKIQKKDELIKKSKEILLKIENERFIDKQKLIEYIFEENDGTYTDIQRWLKLTDYRIVKNLINSDEDIKNIFENKRNNLLDFAKRNIYIAIKDDKDIETSKWVLKSLDSEFNEKLYINEDIKFEIISSNKNIDKL